MYRCMCVRMNKTYARFHSRETMYVFECLCVLKKNLHTVFVFIHLYSGRGPCSVIATR
jgi:hypothetical protein